MNLLVNKTLKDKRFKVIKRSPRYLLGEYDEEQIEFKDNETIDEAIKKYNRIYRYDGITTYALKTYENEIIKEFDSIIKLLKYIYSYHFTRVHEYVNKVLFNIVGTGELLSKCQDRSREYVLRYIERDSELKDLDWYGIAEKIEYDLTKK